jgi:hypothetical protein
VRFRGRATEIRPAKTIFHVSGWQAWPRPVAVACSGWPYCDRGRIFLSLGSVRSLVRRVVTWFGFDHQRRCPGGRISHPLCWAICGPVLPGDRPFLVSRTYHGCARRQAVRFWNDCRGCLPCLTRAWLFFPRWSLVWTPRNCDSALIAAIRFVRAHRFQNFLLKPIVESSFQPYFTLCQSKWNRQSHSFQTRASSGTGSLIQLLRALRRLRYHQIHQRWYATSPVEW